MTWDGHTGTYRKFQVPIAAIDKLIMKIKSGYIDGKPTGAPGTESYDHYVDLLINETINEYTTVEEAV